MKSFFRQLLSDKGDLSMTRFLSLVCMAAAILICMYVVYKEQPLDSAVGIVSTFLAAGFGGKVVQSFAENKTSSEEDKE